MSNFTVVFGNKTDVGKHRQRNEDYMESFKSSFGNVFVVCDGMGGHEGGEIASRLAVTTIKRIIIDNPNNITNPSAIIQEAMSVANRALITKSTEDTSLRGMGTTCVVLIIKDHNANYGHVGDSRLYMVRNSKIYQMTRDHSFVQGLVDQGLISWDEAENHPRKNEITQALGIFDKINPEVNEKSLELFKGDKFVICTDGLSGSVSDKEILAMAVKFSPVEASEKLVAMANANGGPDNITVQIVEIAEGLGLPVNEADFPPDGAITKSSSLKAAIRSIGTNIDPNISQVNNKVKKRNVLIPAVFILVALAAIVILITWDPFSGKNNVLIQKNDSLGTKSGDSIVSHVRSKRLFENLKLAIAGLYKGKDAPRNFNFNDSIEFSKDFQYKGSKGPSQKMTFDEIRKNIVQNDLKFVRADSLQKKDTSDFAFNFDVNYGDKTNTYELTYTVKESKLIVIKQIVFQRESPKQKNKIESPEDNKKHDQEEIKDKKQNPQDKDKTNPPPTIEEVPKDKSNENEMPKTEDSK